MKLTELMTSHNMTTARFQAILASGILTDVFDQKADLGNRLAVCEALSLDTERVGVYRFSVDYDKSVSDRMDACKKDFPWHIATKENLFDKGARGCLDVEGRLLSFPAGISEKNVQKKIMALDRSRPWMPAQPDHMLAFATKYSHVIQQIEARYIVGGSDCPTVLLRLFQGLAAGCKYVFTDLTAGWYNNDEIPGHGHDGGVHNVFLVVRGR
jgi:hypothetical protein